MLNKTKAVLLATVLILSLAGCSGSSAQKTGDDGSWLLTQSIEFVCQSAAGGGSDLMARAIAEYMRSEGIIDQAIVVNNITGSGSVRAYNYTLGKAGDPYYWQTVNTGFFVAPVSGNIDKDYRDYTLIAVIGTDPLILCTSPDSPYQTFEDVVAASQAQPKSVSVCIGSAGSSGSCGSILMETVVGIELTQIPFEGGADGITAVMGNQVDLSWNNIGEVMGPVENGLMNVIAIAATERSEALPHVPTFRELGYDVVYEVPRAIAAPPDMPQEAYEFYCDAFVKLNESEVWQKNYIEANYIFPRFAVGEDCLPIFAEVHEIIWDVYDSLDLAVGRR